MQRVTAAFLGLMVAVSIGCNDDKAKTPSQPSDRPAAPIIQAKPQRDEVKEATDSFPEFCRKVVAEQQAIFRGKKFTEQVRSFTLTYEVTISDDFTYDVKKSNSLLTPVVGELYIKGRSDGMMAGLPITGEWRKSKVECSYRNGRWQTDTKAEGSVFKPQ